ncbi:MAG: hypothetical protein JNM56_17375, partial [Planctomycetia bacterium]|nr:hypothetical protein [Planctomycetia bacterium]
MQQGARVWPGSHSQDATLNDAGGTAALHCFNKTQTQVQVQFAQQLGDLGPRGGVGRHLFDLVEELQRCFHFLFWRQRWRLDGLLPQALDLLPGALDFSLLAAILALDHREDSVTRGAGQVTADGFQLGLQTGQVPFGQLQFVT